MGYSNYKSLRQCLKRLKIEEIEENLFPDVVSVEPSDWLRTTLNKSKDIPLNNEKSKSEWIIAPILGEVALAYKGQVTLYSGEELFIDETKDLTGVCDFFISKHSKKQVMQSPIITLAEARDEDLDYGQGQCLAQMYAAQIFNEQEGHPQKFVYGCAMTGGDWKFMKLENQQVFIEPEVFYLSDLPKILGIFHHIIQLYLQ